MSDLNTGKKADFTLFSSYHKPFPVPQLSFIKPIHAGRANASIDLGFEGDNYGDNISELNQYWSELTVVYYVWKNFKKEELPFWGLCHYRRYFTRRLGWNLLKREYFLSPPEKAFEEIFTTELTTTINDQLKLGRVIIPTPYRFYKLKKWSVKKQYYKDHDAASWEATEKIITLFYPEFIESAKKVMNGLTCSWYNMMIASWDFWDDYLNWLFDILFKVQSELEKRLEPVPLRIYGNLSERLLNIYIDRMKTLGQKIKYLPIAIIL